MDNIKKSAIEFIHPHSIEVAIKAIIAWEAKPEVVQMLTALHIPPDWIKHEMAWFAAILWAVDRLHKLYETSQAPPQTPLEAPAAPPASSTASPASPTSPNP